MSKMLQVIEPFFILEVGDTLNLSGDGKSYVYERNEEFRKATAHNGDVSSHFSSMFSISIDHAKELIEEGFLAEVTADKSTQFVNIFNEIDTLLDKYTKELSNIDKDMVNEPICLKVEKTTVLKNMIKLLNHLKSLKK